MDLAASLKEDTIEHVKDTFDSAQSATKARWKLLNETCPAL